MDILAAINSGSLITFLVAVVVALVVFVCVGYFVADSRIRNVVGLILGLVVLLYGLKIFGLIV